MEYITIEKHIVTGHFCGQMPKEKDRKKGVTYLEVSNYNALVGVDVRVFEDTKSWIKRPLSELVKDKLIAIPDKQKLSPDGLSFVGMSNAELVAAGFLKLKPTEKLDGEHIALKTEKELFDEGLMSAKEYNNYIDQCRQSAYAMEADPLGMQVLRGAINKKIWLKKIDEIKERFPKV